MNNQETTTQSVIVYGPQGCGKTTHAKAIAAHFGLKYIIDWNPGQPILEDHLYLTNATFAEIESAKLKRELYCKRARAEVVPAGVVSFDDIARKLGWPITPAPVLRPRFCIDCRHVRYPEQRDLMCASSDTRTLDLVLGYQDTSCRDARLKGRPCGPTGKLFESDITSDAGAA